MKIGKKIGTYGIITILIIVSLMGLSGLTQAANTQNEIQYVNRGEIYIWDNDFTLANGVSTGNGTEYDPYIIENWAINGSDTGYGIILEETDAYCIIRDCYIYGARDSPFGDSSGILLWTVENVIIENCTIDDNDIGITVDISSDVLINNCNLDANGVESTGGIDFTGIEVISSDNITISSNEITNDESKSIRVYNCEYCIIEDNYVANGTDEGIDITRTTNSIIRDNYVVDCQVGLYAIGSLAPDSFVEYNCIYNNTFILNRGSGIYFYNTENNTFYYNNLIDNNGNVMEYNELYFNGGYYSNIWWYSNTKNVGNYYSDYTGADTTGDGIGEEEYVIRDITSEQSNVDMYPLAEPYNGTLPTPPATVDEVVNTLLVGLLPVIIILIVIKKMFDKKEGVFRDMFKKVK